MKTGDNKIGWHENCAYDKWCDSVFQDRPLVFLLPDMGKEAQASFCY